MCVCVCGVVVTHCASQTHGEGGRQRRQREVARPLCSDTKTQNPNILTSEASFQEFVFVLLS